MIAKYRLRHPQISYNFNISPLVPTLPDLAPAPPICLNLSRWSPRSIFCHVWRHPWSHFTCVPLLCKINSNIFFLYTGQHKNEMLLRRQPHKHQVGEIMCMFSLQEGMSEHLCLEPKRHGNTSPGIDRIKRWQHPGFVKHQGTCITLTCRREILSTTR